MSAVTQVYIESFYLVLPFVSTLRLACGNTPSRQHAEVLPEPHLLQHTAAVLGSSSTFRRSFEKLARVHVYAVVFVSFSNVKAMHISCRDKTIAPHRS